LRVAGVAQAWRMSLAEVGIVYGTVPFIWMTMLPSRRADRVSLVPLRDLVTIFAHGPLTAAVQIVGNLLVLAALGFSPRCGSRRWPRRHGSWRSRRPAQS
jgi:hypothetical protein